jgi:hypothetical protein
MTSYAASWTYAQNGNAYFHDFVLKPVTYPIRIIQVEFSSSTASVNIARYAASAISGGTAIGSVPLREGSAPAATTAKAGAVTITGTPFYFAYNVVDNSTPPGTPYKPLSDLLVAVGSSFGVTCAAPTAAHSRVVINFEELHLARSG